MLKKAIILGAGPAGLAVADDLLRRTDIQPILLEPSFGPDELPEVNADPFLEYLIGLKPDVRKSFGWIRRIRIFFSRLWARLFLRRVHSLEDVIVNRFGWQLYLHFFKHYAEKVWGVPCNAILDGWEMPVTSGSPAGATSGAGDDPAAIALSVEQRGGKILHHQNIYAIYAVPHEICSVHVIDALTGELSLYTADYFFSTIPIRDLIRVVQAPVPEEVRNIVDHLLYRDVIRIDIELSQIAIPDQKRAKYPVLEAINDHLYVLGQELKVSRVTLDCKEGFENARGSVRVVMEYCCTKSDGFWAQPDKTIRSLAIDELEQMGLATTNDVVGVRLRRVEKAIPVYSGSYARIGTVKNYTGSFFNLFLVGHSDIYRGTTGRPGAVTLMDGPRRGFQ
jgi:protoporphyrinogen oxidase